MSTKFTQSIILIIVGGFAVNASEGVWNGAFGG